MPAAPAIPYVTPRQPNQPQRPGPATAPPLRPGRVIGPGKPFLPVEIFDETSGRLYRALQCPRCGTNAGTATDGCVACGYGNADKWTKFSDVSESLFQRGG